MKIASIVLFLGITFSLLEGSASAAPPSFKLGHYSMTTESDRRGGFELLSGGIAKVTELHIVEAGEKDEEKPVKGTWKELPSGVEISYGIHRDELKLDLKCPDWKPHPLLSFCEIELSRQREKLARSSFRLRELGLDPSPRQRIRRVS